MQMMRLALLWVVLFTSTLGASPKTVVQIDIDSAITPAMAAYVKDVILYAEAADIMEQHPLTTQLRYLNTLREIATENNSTTLFPIPIEFMNFFGKKAA